MNFPFINKTIKVKTYSGEICELGTVKFFIYRQQILVKGAFIMVMITIQQRKFILYQLNGPDVVRFICIKSNDGGYVVVKRIGILDSSNITLYDHSSYNQGYNDGQCDWLTKKSLDLVKTILRGTGETRWYEQKLVKNSIRINRDEYRDELGIKSSQYQCGYRQGYKDYQFINQLFTHIGLSLILDDSWNSVTDKKSSYTGATGLGRSMFWFTRWRYSVISKSVISKIERIRNISKMIRDSEQNYLQSIRQYSNYLRGYFAAKAIMYLSPFSVWIENNVHIRSKLQFFVDDSDDSLELCLWNLWKQKHSRKIWKSSKDKFGKKTTMNVSVRRNHGHLDVLTKSRYSLTLFRLMSQFSESYYQSRGSPLLIMDAYGMRNLLMFGTYHFQIKTKIKLQKNVPKYYSSA